MWPTKGKISSIGVGDHENLTLGPLRRERANRLRGVLRLAEKIADQHHFRARPDGFGRRQAGRRSAAQTLVRGDRFGEALDDSARRQRAREADEAGALAAAHRQIRQGERQYGGAIDLGAGREVGGESHRGRAVEPDPDGVRGFPFALAHEGAVLARRAAPVDARRRLAGDEGAKLPERFARSRLPPPVHAVHQAVRDLPRGDDEARQARREGRGFLTNALA